MLKRFRYVLQHSLKKHRSFNTLAFRFAFVSSVKQRFFRTKLISFCNKSSKPTVVQYFVLRNYHTFLASELMTVAALHVIPFIVVFQTKCVYAVFFVEVIRLILGPGCKVPSCAIRPREHTLLGDIV